MKHTGRLNSTTRKVVVVFPQLPDDSEHCLIVETETMPDKYHDNIMQIVESAEAQDTNSLSDVLARKMFWDGTDECLKEIEDFRIKMEIPKHKTFIMPAGDTRKELIKMYPLVFDLCAEHGYNLTGRDHIIAFDTERGV